MNSGDGFVGAESSVFTAAPPEHALLITQLPGGQRRRSLPDAQLKGSNLHLSERSETKKEDHFHGERQNTTSTHETSIEEPPE